MGRQFVYMEDTVKGKKYFFVDNGLVIYKAMKEKNIEEKIWLEKFVKAGKRELIKQKNTAQEGKAPSEELTEKQKVDYQDIVFSECMKNSEAVIPIQD